MSVARSYQIASDSPAHDRREARDAALAVLSSWEWSTRLRRLAREFNPPSDPSQLTNSEWLAQYDRAEVAS